MTIYNNGVFVPPTVVASFSGNTITVLPSLVALESLNVYAGAAVGSAVVSWPVRYATDSAVEMGKSVRLKIGSRTVFRGVVGDELPDIQADDESLSMVLYCDKWRMQERQIGQVGIGTQPTTPAEDIGKAGFKDVGFDVVFNLDGNPNKDPAALEFNTGSTATLWTLKEVLEWVFTYYVSDTAVELQSGTITALSTAYDRKPSHLDLTGMTALDAVDSIVSLTGESWGLIPGSSVSAFTPVRPGYGTQRTAWLMRPKGLQRAEAASDMHAGAVSVPRSIRAARDVYQAVSDRVVKETTYSTEGDDPLLIGRALFTDPKYYVRFYVDVSMYEDNALGANLSAGSKSKPWLKQLLTRLDQDGSSYITAAQLLANPALSTSERVPKPVVWISPDGTIENARACVGGFRIDYDNAMLDFKANLELAVNGQETPETVTYEGASTWTDVGVWLTVVTVLETVDYKESAPGSVYLPAPRYEIIHKSDLQPERRENVKLPDLAGAKNDIVDLADEGEEVYIDVADRLQDAIDSALEATPEVESPLKEDLPFIPEINIGDRLEVSGRNLRLSGKEVVTAIRYRFDEGVPDVVAVEATNITAAIESERFVEEN